MLTNENVVRQRKQLRAWDSKELPGLYDDMEKRARALLSDANVGDIEFRRDYQAYSGVVSTCTIRRNDTHFWRLMQHPMFEILDEDSGVIKIVLEEPLFDVRVRVTLEVKVEMPQDAINTLEQVGKIKWISPEPMIGYMALVC